jgi:CRP/FNR family transcriptional regulator, cyclic AMP receptor protein
MANEMSALAALRMVPLFQGFSEHELIELSSLFVQLQPGPSGVLFDVGDPSTSLYVLTHGEVTLDAPGDDTFRLRPPSLIGELGALTAIHRSTKAVVGPGTVIFGLAAKELQRHLATNQELGLRFLVNLLSVVADKVQRDQVRIADMRKNLVGTQRELKRVRDLILEAVETPLSSPVHDALDKLIAGNRRVNYRVDPPDGFPVSVRMDHGDATVVDLSRTHTTLEFYAPKLPCGVGDWISGVINLAGTEIPLSGNIMRAKERRVTISHDLMIDEFAQALEGYLTRVQLLDVLV